MKEKEIICAAGIGFKNSEFGDKVNAVTGINYNKTPFIAGFIRGVIFYANHLYRKSFIKIIRSILDTKDAKEYRPLEIEEYAILYVLKNYDRLDGECIKMAKTINRLNRELSQTKERAKTNERILNEQIENLEYWLANIGNKDFYNQKATVKACRILEEELFQTDNAKKFIERFRKLMEE